MHKVIDEYALEGKKKNGDPSQVFKMDKAGSMRLGKEVIKRSKQLDDKKADEFMKQYFSRTFEHFDVNKEGMLDANDMTAFCKYLASDQGIDMDELMKY